MIKIKDIERWYESSHYRNKSDWICIDQPKVIEEWKESQTIGQLVCAKDFQKSDWMENYPCLEVDHKWLSALTSKPSHPGCMMLLKRPSYKIADLLIVKRVLLLDGIQDPGNLGTMIRSMVAFGVDTLCLTDHCADPFHPKSISASSGTISQIKIFHESHWIDWIEKAKLPVLVLDPLAPLPINEIKISNKFILVCGSEGRGIQSKLVTSRSITPVSIPISSKVESLNAAMSVSIALNRLIFQ